MPTVYPAPGSIKSIQRGTTNATVTVSAVNMAKSILTHNGSASDTNNPSNASLALTSSTQITYSKGALAATPNISWQLVEYN